MCLSEPKQCFLHVTPFNKEADPTKLNENIKLKSNVMLEVERF